MKPLVPISCGELVDKIAILEIKADKIGYDAVALEYETLLEVAGPILESVPDHLVKGLKAVNVRLWNIGDSLRKKELQREFDSEFIELSRQWIYLVADVRHALKKQIDELADSEIREVKAYAKY